MAVEPATGTGAVRRLLGSRRQSAPNGSVSAPIRGPIRSGTKTKNLVKKLQPGEIALINHADLDRIAAEDLAASGAIAVVNAAMSSTGHYPNIGPLILARAGVPLLDIPDTDDRDLFELLEDGGVAELDGNRLLREAAEPLVGERLSLEETEARLEEQRERIHDALGEFALNTIEHIREESELLSGPVEFPKIRTDFRGRHALLVVRGPDYREDLAALNGYIRDMRPLIVAVDGGADAVLAAGHKPDMILGDMDSATDNALNCGAELVVHAYPDGGAPGRERLQSIGVDHLVVPAAGTSQDVAMLLAHEKGAQLIVTVGAHFNLTEFLDKNRAGMSSTFLTRLRVGEALVDAKGVSRLYRPGIGAGGLALFLATFVLLAIVVVIASPALDNVTDLLWLKIKDVLGVSIAGPPLIRAA